MHRLTVFAIGALLFLSGCASFAQTPVESPDPNAFASLDAERASRLLYQILVGEIAGQRGEFDVSVEHYLQAARDSHDPRVAERAARIALHAGNRAAALAAAERWSVLQPNDNDVRQLLGVLYVQLDRLDEGVEQFVQVVQAARDTESEGFMIVASLLSRERKAEPALTVMRRVIERFPDDVRGQVALARLAVQLGEPAAGVQAAERALTLDPELADARMIYAQALSRLGEPERAIAALSDALEARPDDRDLRLARARLYVQMSRYDEARTDFERLVAARPDDRDLLYTLALLNLEAAHYPEAAEYLQRLLKTDWRRDETLYYLGRVAEAMAQSDEAIEWYGQVGAGDFWLDAQFHIADLMNRAGDVDAARQHLADVRAEVEDDNGLLRLYVAEAHLLRGSGRYQEGVELMNEALRFYPEAEELLYARALLAERMDDLAQAEADLRAILSRDPDNTTALNALGYTLTDRTDRHEEAYELVRRALDQRPDDAAILDSMGWVLYHLGRHDEAETHLRRAAELSDDTEIAGNLASLLWAMGRHDEARAILDGALAREPDNRRLLQVREHFQP
ncbi:MAG: tetratricopeptide repeat protein [Ectothiorhodospiraceae bacterium]|jgi:tetratricopeptide (TPR) repeat protein|nr:tetratricopeptide repeat protein [Ectothiorhodospiraceae bacterium]